jgi:hypothetical protein
LFLLIILANKIIGGVVGGVIGAAILIALVYLAILIRKKRKSRNLLSSIYSEQPLTEMKSKGTEKSLKETPSSESLMGKDEEKEMVIEKRGEMEATTAVGTFRVNF